MATEIQTLQPTQKLNITTQPQNWVGAMSELASTPNALADFAVKLGQSAGMQYQTMKGIEAGKTPSGELLPPATDADKAFIQGYSAQAQQTLGLQAQQLFNQGLTELNKTYKLSNQQISTYSENMQQGLQKILEQAPYTIRTDLANQYTEQIQTNVFRLNNQLLNQQKQENKEQASLYIKNQLNQITNTTMTGGNAETILKNTLKNIDQKEASGLWSATEAQTQRDAVKQQFFSDVLSKGAIEAYNRKEQEAYLSSLTQVPKQIGGVDISYTEFDKARNLAVNNLVQYHRFTDSQQNLLAQQFKLMYESKGLDSFDMAVMKNTLQPQQFNDVYGFILNRERIKSKDNSRQSFLLANASNIDIVSTASSKEKDALFAGKVQEIKNEASYNGKSISDDEAEFQAATLIPTQIPIYNKKLAGRILNGTPEQAIQAANLIEKMEISGFGNRLDNEIGGNGNASKAYTAIRELLPFNTPEDAVAKARAIVNPTEDQKNKYLATAQKWRNDHSTADAMNRAAKKIIPKISGVKIPDESSFYAGVANAIYDNIKYYGDVNMAQEDVKRGLNRNYGVTYANGAPQYMYMPPEMLAEKHGKPAAILVQDNVYNDVSKMVDNMKAISDKNPNMDFYYELPERLSYKDYAKAKLNPENPVSKEIIKDYLSGKPIQITKVYKKSGIRQNYTVGIKSGPFASFNSQTDLMASGYDFILTNEQGVTEPFIGSFDTNGRMPSFMPNIKYINDRYATVADEENDLGFFERSMAAIGSTNIMQQINGVLDMNKTTLTQKLEDLGFVRGGGTENVAEVTTSLAKKINPFLDDDNKQAIMRIASQIMPWLEDEKVSLQENVGNKLSPLTPEIPTTTTQEMSSAIQNAGKQIGKESVKLAEEGLQKTIKITNKIKNKISNLSNSDQQKTTNSIVKLIESPKSATEIQKDISSGIQNVISGIKTKSISSDKQLVNELTDLAKKIDIKFVTKQTGSSKNLLKEDKKSIEELAKVINNIKKQQKIKSRQQLDMMEFIEVINEVFK